MIQKVYKLVIEDVEAGRKAEMYLSGLELLFEGEFFTTKVSDAKTLESFTFKEKLLEQLNTEI